METGSVEFDPSGMRGLQLALYDPSLFCERSEGVTAPMARGSSGWYRDLSFSYVQRGFLPPDGWRGFPLGTFVPDRCTRSAIRLNRP